VILSQGTIVADGKTIDILCNESLMAENRLELPFGFDPKSTLVN
jgi:cobalt/nickel transport system ATP-binding protein